MSYEYTGEFESPLDPESVSAVLQEIAALDYLEVVREEEFQLVLGFATGFLLRGERTCLSNSVSSR
jgi:hypothetical protein